MKYKIIFFNLYNSVSKMRLGEGGVKGPRGTLIRPCTEIPNFCNIHLFGKWAVPRQTMSNYSNNLIIFTYFFSVDSVFPF
jgi:hypothetical protein